MDDLGEPEAAHDSSSPITDQLDRYRQGDSKALDLAFSMAYDELHRIASYQSRRLPAGATLSTTILVHEVYLRLSERESLKIVDSHHLLALCARAMRQVVVDHARARNAKKRSGERPDTAISEFLAEPGNLEVEANFLIHLDRALQKLEELDSRLARIAELRFFGGCTVSEVASILGVSEPTVKRDTRVARACLQRELNVAL